ncbi:Serine/threonine-protein phosphatase 2A regulatory subunit A alpha isoform, partial [Bonamia ostreae]
ELENFDEKFFREVESLLVDKIYRVRKEIGVGITKIYEEISPEKFNAIFWNRIVDLTNSKNYLHRSSALFILKVFKIDSQSLCKVMDKDQVLTLLPVLDKMRKDKVPNIRMHSAICYKRIAERFKDVATTVELALEELRKDSETDVVNAMSFD